MNEFTKEELVIIYCDMDAYVNNPKMLAAGMKVPQHHLDLKDKVERMIENYCEHESYIDIGEAPLICKKCGAVTG